ncbi:type I methionyl aminopeptidase [bacterium]|nr:type I methionyl aminopeptidase [bacterium]MBU1754187.1 type I methionyl aminopeptidase [bacterium]
MIIRRSKQEIDRIADASKIVGEVIQHLKDIVEPGMTTQYIANVAEKMIIKRGGVPAFLGYRGFPGSICTSINYEVVHGIPKVQRLKEGEILKIDIGVRLKDYCSDAASTVKIGKVSHEAERLMAVTEESLYKGIEKAVENNRLYDISAAVQLCVEKHGFSVVRDYTGHGIGQEIHEDPQIPNFGKQGKGPRLKSGMVFCIEPMVNAGGHKTEVLHDGWTVITADRSLSAHFEHTIVVTDNGPMILTG